MLAGKPLPARNASYTYETCGGLGQVCKGTRINAGETERVARFIHGRCFPVELESCRRVPRREPSLDAEGEAGIAECGSELPCARLTS